MQIYFDLGGLNYPPCCCARGSHLHPKGSTHSSEGQSLLPRSHAMIHLVERRKQFIHTSPHLCVLLSRLCSQDWFSPLNWLHFWTIPLSRVRDRPVGPALLQCNWPFKEGLHHVKPCNWEWYSLCSICFFCSPFLWFFPSAATLNVHLTQPCSSWLFFPVTPRKPYKCRGVRWPVAADASFFKTVAR